MKRILRVIINEWEYWFRSLEGEDIFLKMENVIYGILWRRQTCTWRYIWSIDGQKRWKKKDSSVEKGLPPREWNGLSRMDKTLTALTLELILRSLLSNAFLTDLTRTELEDWFRFSVCVTRCFPEWKVRCTDFVIFQVPRKSPLKVKNKKSDFSIRWGTIRNRKPVL